MVTGVVRLCAGCGTYEAPLGCQQLNRVSTRNGEGAQRPVGRPDLSVCCISVFLFRVVFR